AGGVGSDRNRTPAAKSGRPISAAQDAPPLSPATTPAAANTPARGGTGKRVASTGRAPSGRDRVPPPPLANAIGEGRRRMIAKMPRNFQPFAENAEAAPTLDESSGPDGHCEERSDEAIS